MKSLKLNHEFAQAVLSGATRSTWRINDDKDLHVNDNISLIDKIDPLNPTTWQPIGIARITSILEKQLGNVTASDVPGEKLKPLKDLLQEFRAYYGPQVDADTPVKIIRFDFEKQSHISVASSQPALEMQLFTDGGSRGNPGPSACGYVLLDMKGQVLVEKGLALGITTNNQAEYRSLRLGLEAALAKKVTVLHVFMDSMLVIGQMRGSYKVRNTDLAPLYQATQDLAAKFTKITFTHVPRERNKRADAMVNEILNAQVGDRASGFRGPRRSGSSGH